MASNYFAIGKKGKDVTGVNVLTEGHGRPGRGKKVSRFEWGGGHMCTKRRVSNAGQGTENAELRVRDEGTYTRLSLLREGGQLYGWQGERRTGQGSRKEEQNKCFLKCSRGK